MSLLVSQYRRLSLVGVEDGIRENFRFFSQYLEKFGGDVVLALDYLHGNGISAANAPVPSVNTPLTAAQAVIQQPSLQPNCDPVYHTLIVELMPELTGALNATCLNEVTSGLQPVISLWKKDGGWSKVGLANGSSGAANLFSSNSVEKGKLHRLYYSNLVVGKSKCNWWQGSSMTTIQAPVISISGSTITLKPHSNDPQDVKIEWRKQNSGWVWQPYVGTFQRLSGAHTIEVRVTKFGMTESSIATHAFAS